MHRDRYLKDRVSRESNSEKQSKYRVQPPLKRAGFSKPAASLISLLGNTTLQQMVEGRLIQTKLQVNRGGDKYEKQADRMAEKMVNSNHKSPVLNKIERVRSRIGFGAAPKESSAGIRGLKGKGSAMSKPLREFFEPRMGVDLGNIRIHTGSNANRLASSLNARAFTHGRDIVFKDGQYRPGTKAGKKLLAHELVHTMQQGQAGSPIIQRCEDDDKDKKKPVDKNKKVNEKYIKKLNKWLESPAARERPSSYLIIVAEWYKNLKDDKGFDDFMELVREWESTTNRRCSLIGTAFTTLIYKEYWKSMYKILLNSSSSIGFNDLNDFKWKDVYFNDPFKDLDKVIDITKKYNLNLLELWFKKNISSPADKKINSTKWYWEWATYIALASALTYQPLKKGNYNGLAALSLVGEVKKDWLSLTKDNLTFSLFPTFFNYDNLKGNDILKDRSEDENNRNHHILYNLENKANLGLKLPLQFKYQPKGSKNYLSFELYYSLLTILGRNSPEDLRLLDLLGHYIPMGGEGALKFLFNHSKEIENLNKNSPRLTDFASQYGFNLGTKMGSSELNLNGSIIKGDDYLYGTTGLSYNLKHKFSGNREFKFELKGDYSFIKPGPEAISGSSYRGDGGALSLSLQVTNNDKKSVIGASGGFGYIDRENHRGEKDIITTYNASVFGYYQGLSLKVDVKSEVINGEGGLKTVFTVGMPLSWVPRSIKNMGKGSKRSLLDF